MKFYSVAQCSYLDKEFGFDPQWLLEYGHLEDLVEQLREAAVGDDEEVHFVTSNQPADDELAARLNELADGVKRVSEAAYVGDGMVELLEGFEDEAGVVLTSAYLAILPEELLKEAKEKIRENGLDSVRFTLNLRLHLPLFVKTKILKELIHENKANHLDSDNRRPDFPELWFVNPKIPHWIFPPRLDFPMHWELDAEWEVYRDVNDLFEKQRAEAHRPYIMSKNGAEAWSKIKSNSRNHYSELVEEGYKRIDEISPVPLAVQVDISSGESLWDGFDYELQSELDLGLLADSLNEVSKKADLFQTYLQIGNYWDPCEDEKLVEFLKMLDNDGLRVGLHSRGKNLDSQLAEELLNLTDEIFFYFGKPGSSKEKENHDKYRLLWKKRYNKHKSLSSGPYKTLPVISAVYELLEGKYMDKISEIQNKWLDYSSAKTDYQDGVDKFTYEEFYNSYFKPGGLKTRNLIFREPLVRDRELDLNFGPLKRFSCRRIIESLYIIPSGDILPCTSSLEMGGEVKLGVADEVSSIIKKWDGEKREGFVKGQEKNNISFPACSECDDWYKPVI